MKELSNSKYKIEYFINNNKHEIIIIKDERKLEIFGNNIKEEEINKDINNSLSQTSNKKKLYFGQSNLHNAQDLYNKLKEFEKENTILAKNINDISKNNEIKSEKIINPIDNLFKKMEEISNLLKCNCSDDTKFPKIEEKLNDIKNYIEQLKSLLKKFHLYINNNVIKFI